MGMLMLLREDKLRLMGGKYDEREFDDDSDDVLNDSYWSDNYNGGDGEDFPDM